MYNETGEIEHTFRSVELAREYLTNLGFSKNKIESVIKREEPFLGFVWVPDPDYEYSIPCTAYNPEKKETRKYSSISKCGDDILGKTDLSSGQKIRKAIDTGEKTRGWIIKEDENNFVNYNHPNRSIEIGDKRRAVFQIRLSGEIIERFDSCTLAAIPLFLQGVSSPSVKRMADVILQCAKEKCPSIYGYK